MSEEMSGQAKADLIGMLREDAVNRYIAGDETALEHSVAMKPHDPAHWMLTDGHRSTPVTYQRDCYICEDPEFALMGLPLCRKCPRCGGHIPADDERCDDCGASDNPYSRIDADGLAPDGFPEQYLDVDGEPSWPYGDFETCEPFRIQIGTLYDGRPHWFGDYVEPHVLAPGDYVETMIEPGEWRGTVLSIEPGRICPVSVRIDEPNGSTKRFLDQIVHCRPEWLRWLYTIYTLGG